MKNRRYVRHLAVAVAAALVAVSIGLVARGGNAHGDTPTGILTGEGGDAMTPVMLALVNGDTAQLSPDTASYTNVNLDQGIADFVGTAPGSFATDFAVSERALTTDETNTATANGRSFAYVPFAATPVALMTLVPNASYTEPSNGAINPGDFCQHVQLNLADLDVLYGSAANWGSMTCQASSTGTTTTTTTGASTTTTTTGTSSNGLDPIAAALYGNGDPTMENYDLESLLNSTAASTAAYGAYLAKLSSENQADTSSPTPTETWPFSTAIPGGDQVTLGKIIGLDPRTGAPSTEASLQQLGAIMPVASVWTGDPLGVPWNLPTAAIQNAQGSYVAPSSQAAAAAEADATVASNNLVTFNANSNDAAAYNNDMMLESYFVVPLNGLSSDKALALAQLIRFALGSTGQADITALGAAPPTAAMVTAGLQVAQQLDVEAATTEDAADVACSTTTTTSTTPSSSTSTTSASSTTTSSSPTTTTTTAPTSGSTTTTTAPCSTTTTTSGTGSTTTTGSTATTGSTTTVPTSTVCAPTATTTTTAPSTSTTTTSPSTSTSTTSTSTTPSSSTTTTSTTPSTSTTTTSTTPSTSTTTTSSSSTTTTTSESSTTTTTAGDSDAREHALSQSSDTTTSTSPSTSTTSTSPSTSTTSTSPSTSTTSTSPSTTTTTGQSTTTTTAPPTTTTTICPTTTATTTVSSDGDSGSPSDLAFTGMNPVPLVGLGFLLFILGEIGLRSLRKRLGRR
jgi:hypothetical protein